MNKDNIKDLQIWIKEISKQCAEFINNEANGYKFSPSIWESFIVEIVDGILNNFNTNEYEYKCSIEKINNKDYNIKIIEYHKPKVITEFKINSKEIGNEK